MPHRSVAPAAAPSPAAASPFAATDGVSDVPKPHIVAIIGWLGAQEKTLDKYAAWYRDAGWTPLIFTFPAATCLNLARVTARRLACADVLVRTFDAAAAAHGPGAVALLMHSFSNTGWLGYCGLVGDLEAARPAALAALKGVVIDSAPYPAMSPEVWAAGFMTAMASSGRKAGRHAAGAPPPPPPNRSSLAFKAASSFFRVWMQGARKRALKAVIADEARLAAWPALFIFSEDDHVIPASAVRAAAAAHAARPAARGDAAAAALPARTLAFTRSEHVAHLRHHRSAYLAALDAFVARDVLGKAAGRAATAVAGELGRAAHAAPAAPPPPPPLVRAASRTLSRSLSTKLDPASLGALARANSIKAGGGLGAGGGHGLARLASIRAGGVRPAAAASGPTTPTAAVVASLRASLPQLM